ncbi:VOC family protein [Actinomyces sp. ZJ308]|uniref:VOC family protein n=1 Tax=Actinomyces sp. ZJ308 TaxID=2708342 RepID=UPI001422AE0D|nr:VOC family protein [Actinomyces sp. ZJ308]
MTRVGHVIYKADDLAQAVSRFRQEGFDVEYGQARSPRNAVIYFSTGPYLEIISGVRMPRLARAYLRMLGHHRMVADSDSVAQQREGYSRIVLEVEREEFTGLASICRDHGLRTLTPTISRKDVHGRRLSCLCLVPDDWSVPMFVTPFAVDTHRDSAHPNGITRIERIVFEGSAAAVDICRRSGAEDRLSYRLGAGDISVRFA